MVQHYFCIAKQKEFQFNLYANLCPSVYLSCRIAFLITHNFIPFSSNVKLHIEVWSCCGKVTFEHWHNKRQTFARLFLERSLSDHSMKLRWGDLILKYSRGFFRKCLIFNKLPGTERNIILLIKPSKCNENRVFIKIMQAVRAEWDNCNLGVLFVTEAMH